MKGTLPRPELSARLRQSATKCHDEKFDVSSTHLEGEVHGYCYLGNRSRQERLCGPWRRCHRHVPCRANSSKRTSRQVGGAGRGAAALSDRDGGVLGCPSLGSAFCCAWPSSASDGTQVRYALPNGRQGRQERRGLWSVPARLVSVAARPGRQLVLPDGDLMMLVLAMVVLSPAVPGDLYARPARAAGAAPPAEYRQGAAASRDVHPS